MSPWNALFEYRELPWKQQRLQTALMVSFLEDEDSLHTLAWEGLAPGRSWDFEIPSDYVGDEQVKIGVSYSVIVPNPRVIRDMVI